MQHESKWGKDRCFQLPMQGAFAAPSPTTRSVPAFIGYKHRVKAMQLVNEVLSPWNCTEGSLEGDYQGCAFAPSSMLLHSSLQGHHTFMAMVPEHNQAASCSSSCWQSFAAASRGHFSSLTSPACVMRVFGWHSGDLSSLLQAPRRAAWPAQLDPGPVNNHASACWGMPRASIQKAEAMHWWTLSHPAKLFLTSDLNHIELKATISRCHPCQQLSSKWWRVMSGWPDLQQLGSAVSGGRFLWAIPGPVTQRWHQEASWLPGDTLFLDTYMSSCERWLLREPGWPFHLDCWKQVGVMYFSIASFSDLREKWQSTFIYKYILLISFQDVFRVFEILQFYCYHLNAMKFSRKKGHSAWIALGFNTTKYFHSVSVTGSTRSTHGYRSSPTSS